MRPASEPQRPHRRTHQEQARVEESLRELFEQRISFNQLLGLRITSFDPAAPSLRLEMRPDLVGHYLYGRLHGGVIASVLDATGGFAVMCGIAHKHADDNAAQVMHRFGRLGTIDLRVDFLRPGVGQWFQCTAQLVRLGGRIVSTRMDLVNDAGTLIGTAAGAYIIS